MEEHITLFELLELIILFSLPVSLISRIVQFIHIKFNLEFKTGRSLIIAGASEILCWIFTGLCWFLVPVTYNDGLLLHVIFIPTLIAEFIILLMTFILYRRKAAL